MNDQEIKEIFSNIKNKIKKYEDRLENYENNQKIILDLIKKIEINHDKGCSLHSTIVQEISSVEQQINALYDFLRELTNWKVSIEEKLNQTVEFNKKLESQLEKISECIVNINQYIAIEKAKKEEREKEEKFKEEEKWKKISQNNWLFGIKIAILTSIITAIATLVVPVIEKSLK